MRHPDVVIIAQDTTDSRVQGDEWNKDHILPALSADLDDPAENTSVMWMSDGTESGNNGDILIKTNVAGVTVIKTFSFSSASTGITWVEKTANYTAVTGQGILADTTGGVFTITLPLSPTVGDTVGFQDSLANFTTNNLTINRNGKKIHGISENLVCDILHASFLLIYSGATQGWKLDTYYAGTVVEESIGLTFGEDAVTFGADSLEFGT